MAKIYGMIALGAILSAVGWWLLDTVQENERLTLSVATLEQLRQDDAAAIEALEADSAEKEAAILRRTKKIIELNNRILKAKDEVRVITKTVVTEVERECLNQSVPASIVKFMLDEGEAGSPTGSD